MSSTPPDRPNRAVDATEDLDGWDDVAADVLRHAKRQALKALELRGPAPAQDRLARFYDVDGDYAGATFANLQPNDPDVFTAADVTAASLLSVRVEAGAVRRLLRPGPHRTAITAALSSIPDVVLGDADAATFARMLDLHCQVKAVLSGPHVRTPRSWVVASKLCARKRPALFPVRDRTVCAYLGTLSLSSVRTDWLVFRHLITDEEVLAGIRELVEAVPDVVGERTVRLDGEPLRRLDAALWTAARAGL